MRHAFHLCARGPPTPEVGEGWRSRNASSPVHLSQPHCPILPTCSLSPALFLLYRLWGNHPDTKLMLSFCMGSKGLFKNVNWIMSSPLLKILWWLPTAFTITFKLLTVTAGPSTPPQPLSLSLHLTSPRFSSLSLSTEFFSSCHCPLLPSEVGKLWPTSWLAFVALL